MLDVDITVDRRGLTVAARLRVGDGERLALFGPSGAGKTTILEVVAGLVTPARGAVVVDGRTLTDARPGRRCRSVPPWRRRVGLLRQNPALFPHLTVRRNICYAPGAAARTSELAETTRRLGVDGLLDARPAALSGGQAHRVALARLLLAHCDALLLDEPYAGLDPASRRRLTALLREVVADRRLPAVLVAHELEEAQAFADRIAVLDAGTILQVASPHDVVRRPKTRRVAELVGYRGFVPVAGDGSAVAGVHPDRVVAGARPERGLVLRGTVVAWRPSAANWEADLDVAGIVACCRFPRRQVDEGSQLSCTAVDPPVFGSDGRLLPGACADRAGDMVTLPR